jgi:hypothetical protein
MYTDEPMRFSITSEAGDPLLPCPDYTGLVQPYAFDIIARLHISTSSRHHPTCQTPNQRPLRESQQSMAYRSRL